MVTRKKLLVWRKKKNEMMSDQEIRWMWEDIINESGSGYNIGVGSGFSMDYNDIKEASVSSNVYETRTGRGHVVLPGPFNSSACGLENIRNEDDMCFKYCITAATNPPRNNASRVDYYISKKNQDKLYGAFD
jgi:hypothetical protein